MIKIIRIIQVIVLCIGCSYIQALPTNQIALDISAQKIINSQPTESSIEVMNIFESYRSLEKRWVGSSNSVFNHNSIEKSNFFAKTQIFNESYHTTNEKVKYLRLKYDTNYMGQTHHVSGLLLLPPTDKPKGVVLFFHSTMTGKLRVPSLKFEEYKTTMLSAIFAANGYVVIAPDYIGLGDDYKSEHPYILYPRPNVTDGHDMLLASLDVLKKYNVTFGNKIPLFVSGYSEGASYALWFSRIYQSDKQFMNSLNKYGYELSKTVPIDGAYDVSGVMLPFLLGNQINEKSNTYGINSPFWGTLLKPSLMANALLAYSSYNKIPKDKIFNPKFYNISCINGTPFCNTDSSSGYNIDNVRLISTSNLRMALNYYFAAFDASENGVAYGLFNNSVKDLINPDLINSKLLIQTAKDADIVNWKSNNPITLVSLAHDSLVPEMNSRNAYDGMLKFGSTNIKYIEMDNNLLKSRALLGPSVADHVSFELYALLIALQEFNNTSVN